MNKMNPAIETLWWYDYMEKPISTRSEEYQQTVDKYSEVLEQVKPVLSEAGKSELFSELDSAVGAYIGDAEKDAYNAGFKTALSLFQGGC